VQSFKKAVGAKPLVALIAAVSLVSVPALVMADASAPWVQKAKPKAKAVQKKRRAVARPRVQQPVVQAPEPVYMPPEPVAPPPPPPEPVYTPAPPAPPVATPAPPAPPAAPLKTGGMGVGALGLIAAVAAIGAGVALSSNGPSSP
jgi:hypothetical protein